MSSWNGRLVDQLDWHWDVHLRPGLSGLTNEEYFWEPAPDCWSVRRRGDEKTNLAGGSGEYVMEIEYPEPDPPPMTTIAWRLAHLTITCFGERARDHFDGTTLDFFSHDFAATAETALADLDHCYKEWIDGFTALGDEGLENKVGASEPFPEASFAELAAHVNREAIHHGAEILLLRNLFTASKTTGQPTR